MYWCLRLMLRTSKLLLRLDSATEVDFLLWSFSAYFCGLSFTFLRVVVCQPTNQLLCVYVIFETVNSASWVLESTYKPITALPPTIVDIFVRYTSETNMIKHIERTFSAIKRTFRRLEIVRKRIIINMDFDVVSSPTEITLLLWLRLPVAVRYYRIKGFI